jgi:hypothetical protein
LFKRKPDGCRLFLLVSYLAYSLTWRWRSYIYSKRRSFFKWRLLNNVAFLLLYCCVSWNENLHCVSD